MCVCVAFFGWNGDQRTYFWGVTIHQTAITTTTTTPRRGTKNTTRREKHAPRRPCAGPWRGRSLHGGGSSPRYTYMGMRVKKDARTRKRTMHTIEFKRIVMMMAAPPPFQHTHTPQPPHTPASTAPGSAASPPPAPHSGRPAAPTPCVFFICRV